MSSGIFLLDGQSGSFIGILDGTGKELKYYANFNVFAICSLLFSYVLATISGGGIKQLDAVQKTR